MNSKWSFAITLATLGLALTAVPSQAQYWSTYNLGVPPRVSRLGGAQSVYINPNTSFALVGAGGVLYQTPPYNPYWYAPNQNYGPAMYNGNQMDENQLLDGSAIPGQQNSTAGYGPTVQRTDESIDAQYLSTDRLQINWRGDTRIVDHIVFAILDKAHGILALHTINQLPAQTQFVVDDDAAYYRTIVHYIDGTTKTTVAPIKPVQTTIGITPIP